MKALISSIEPCETGYRVAQVEADTNIFAVAEGMFWMDCADDVVADQFWYDPADKQIKLLSEYAVVEAAENQPTVNGAETL